MKRLAMATVLLTAVAVGAQAGSFPKPIRMLDRMKMFSSTHSVRGPEKAKKGHASSTAEARQEARPATDQQKPETKPARAD